MALSGLDSALSGLRIAQQQLNVISNNVANVSTPGYSRKVLPQETSVLLGQTAGAKGSPIIRNVDLNLERDLWTQVSNTQFYGIQAGYLDQIQQFHGAPDAEISIAAEIAGLRDSFAELVNAPDNNLQLQLTVGQATSVANKFNDFSGMLTQMRNDAQDQMRVSVDRANALLQQIAGINKEIKANSNVTRSNAHLEDLRDTAVKSLSEEMGISFFMRSDGVMVIQTIQGQQLADENTIPLYFDPNSIGATSYYPASVSGLYVGGDPVDVPNASDITQIGVGGKIGAYIELRDNTLPKYQSQLDELAHKMALRFDAQGIRLFTDATGAVPPDTAPIPNPPGPLTPVPYVGFASTIQVNDAIVNDNTLLRTGTIAGLSVQQGSSEFLRRAVEFTFGEFEYLQAGGNVDVRVAALPDTLQNVFGLNPRARMVGEVDIRSLSTGTPLNQSTDNPFLPPSGPPLLDDFTIQFDPGGPNDTGVLTIDLGAVDIANPTPPAASGAQALVDYINTTVIPGLAPPLNTAITASLNQFGQLLIDSQYSFDIQGGTMNTPGLEYLGLTAGTTVAQSPYFDVQVGKDDPVRIDVDPGDTEVDLLAKLNAVTGLQASVDPLTGFLNIRPGPGFGGDIKVTDGPIFSTGGASILTELFGSSNPISGVAHAPFRSSQLGQGVNMRTGLVDPLTLVEYSQKMVSSQTEDINTVDAAKEDEESFKNLLERQLMDESGVNIDEELSHLIVVQTAYSAAAKTISTIDEMFRDLLNAF